MSTLPVFVTGNAKKAEYLSRFLGLELEHQGVELEEIQSTDLEHIASYKAKQAYAALSKPVLVEDVAMGYTELDGLPGAFIKFFVEQDNGFEKICRMGDGLASRQAIAWSVFAYYDGQTMRLFRGSLKGTIAQHSSGIERFGWDCIFCPDGYNGLTRSELSEADNEKTYKQIKPLDEIREFLTSLE
ncbi:MAG: XTP/dITP diphosphohydrolase [Patescibacteria group bacterium]|nr:non-canonical purine NTP pyrophosphatase [Candidatus Saccharibacteria bacterium]MDQ5963475.1 XTP/dITP diphosphohydrolase [Patescibacteria group bacterium]